MEMKSDGDEVEKLEGVKILKLRQRSRGDRQYESPTVVKRWQ